MLRDFRSWFFSGSSAQATLSFEHKTILDDNRSLYAIGDLHGCVSVLRRLEAAISDDLNGGDAHVVLLGDVIDRGPDSAGLLDHLLRRAPSGLTRHVLMGNHEAMFLRFLANPSLANAWLDFGGIETLLSYGIDAHSFTTLPRSKQRLQLDAHIPSAHTDFVAKMPAVISWRNVVFAHAGIDFTNPLNAQIEDTLLWSRAPVSPEMVPEGRLFVHGHFPKENPELSQSVINMDVGTYLRNRACALRIDPNGHMALIEV